MDFKLNVSCREKTGNSVRLVQINSDFRPRYTRFETEPRCRGGKVQTKVSRPFGTEYVELISRFVFKLTGFQFKHINTRAHGVLVYSV